MKYTYILLLLTIFTIDSIAINWQHDIKDVFIQTIDNKGNKKHSVDIKTVDYFIGVITPYARQYPPKFKNKQDQEEVTERLYQLSKIFEVLVHNEPNNVDILNRAAFVNNMAHNVNIKGSTVKSKKYYEKSLSINPKSPEINYQFLVPPTERWDEKSAPVIIKNLQFQS